MVRPSIPLLTTTLALVSFAAAVAVNNTIYVISNAEAPSFQLTGLTPIGLKRVQDCLPPLLAPLDIGLVISCPFDPDSGYCNQTLATADPLATGLGLTADTSCGADDDTDDDCVSDLIKTFGATSTKAVLIVWDLNDLDDVFDDLNVDDDFEDKFFEDYDDDDDDTLHYDLLYTVVRNRVQDLVSQACEGIDGQAPGTSRRSLRRRAFRKRTPKKRTISSRIARARFS